jgi:hypothetical protein
VFVTLTQPHIVSCGSVQIVSKLVAVRYGDPAEDPCEDPKLGFFDPGTPKPQDPCNQAGLLVLLWRRSNAGSARPFTYCATLCTLFRLVFYVIHAILN